MFRGKVVNFPTDCTLSLSLSLSLFSVPVIIPAIDNLISELLQFRWWRRRRRRMLKKRKRRGGGAAEWLKAVHVDAFRTRSSSLSRGKVELTYWDRSDRLVAFMYPPCRRATPKRSPLLFFLPLPPIYSPWTKGPSFSFYILEPSTEKNRREFESEILYLKYFFRIRRIIEEKKIVCELQLKRLKGSQK